MLQTRVSTVELVVMIPTRQKDIFAHVLRNIMVTTVRINTTFVITIFATMMENALMAHAIVWVFIMGIIAKRQILQVLFFSFFSLILSCLIGYVTFLAVTCPNPSCAAVRGNGVCNVSIPDVFNIYVCIV